MLSDIISISANIALVLSVVVALAFGIAQVRQAARDRRERFSLEALHNFQSREFAEMMHYIVTREMPKSRKELEALPANDQIIFIQLSQQMEQLGLLVAANLVDLGLVERTLGSFVTQAWKKYETMFLRMRENDPYIGEYFQWLAQQVEKQMHETPREPFYKRHS
jgi:hypothetical protein